METEKATTVSILEKLKDLLRRQTQLGRLLWLRSLLLCLHNLWTFYPIRRLCNLLYYLYLVKVRRYKPLKLDDNIKNGVFYLCLAEKDKETLLFKLPHLNSVYSYSLCKHLRDSKAFDEYSDILKSLPDDPILGEHIPCVKEIKRGGAYWSSYINGYNLIVVRDMLLKGHSLPADLKPTELINAIDELLQKLQEFKDSNGQVVGDWGIHNLIYDKATHGILNVDLEGFFLYRDGSFQVDVLYKQALPWLKSLKEMLRIQESQIPEDLAILKTLSLVDFATNSTVAYCGSGFPSGYHSLMLRGRSFRGQRECATRLATIPYDFTDKVVLDLGCNCGGMIHCIADKILAGVGADRDPKYINAANAIKNLNGADNLNFFILDLDNDDLNIIDSFVLDKKVDICFLLSICMWLKNWKRVITRCSLTADTLLFESNGSDQQQKEQVEFLRQTYSSVELIDSESHDDLIQNERALYLCHGVSEG